MNDWHDRTQETFRELLAALAMAKRKYPTDTVVDLIKRAIRCGDESIFSEVYTSDEQTLKAVMRLNEQR